MRRSIDVIPSDPQTTMESLKPRNVARIPWSEVERPVVCTFQLTQVFTSNRHCVHGPFFVDVLWFRAASHSSWQLNQAQQQGRPLALD